MSTDIELNNMETEITDNHLDVSKIVMKGPVLTEYDDDGMFLNFKKGLFLIISISSIFLYVVYSIIFLVVRVRIASLSDTWVVTGTVRKPGQASIIADLFSPASFARYSVCPGCPNPFS